MSRRKIFISYSRSDQDFAESIWKALADSGLPVWIDQQDIAAGTSFNKVIHSALDEASMMLVIVGENGLGRWQKAEVETAIKAAEDKPDLRVVPILLPHADESMLPLSLRGRLAVDLRDAHSTNTQLMRLAAVLIRDEGEATEAPSDEEIADRLYDSGDLTAARRAYLHAISALDEENAEPSAQKAALLRKLGSVLYAQGDLKGASEAFEQAFVSDRLLFGTEHESTASNLAHLAAVQRGMGDLSGAREMLERSLAIKRSVYGIDEHPSVAASLHELAGVLQAQGDLSGARERLERSLAIKRSIYGTDEHPDITASLHDLAGLEMSAGHSEEAMSLLNRVLDIESRIYGTREHYSTAETEILLALLLLNAGQQEEAFLLLAHAVPILQAQVPKHPLLRSLGQKVE